MVNIGAARAALVSYQIGNSLTNDTGPTGGLQALAPGARRYWVPNYHIRSSAELKYIYDNPTDVSLESGGIWNAALPGRYRTKFAFQPFLTNLSAGSTQGTDATAIGAFVTAIQAGPSSAVSAPYYGIYCAWPSVTNIAGNYQTYWAQAVVNNSSTATIMKAAYFSNLYSVLQSSLPTTPYIIPAGHVFNQLDIMARSGQIPGATTAADFYRDDLHMGTVGRFVAACTVFSCFFKMKAAANSTAIALYQSYGGSSLTLDAAMATIVQDTVWDVVIAESRTGAAA